MAHFRPYGPALFDYWRDQVALKQPGAWPKRSRSFRAK
jgi:hypothetical protein